MTDGPRSGEQLRLPAGPPPRNHGNTPAAWATVTTVLVGAVIAAVAFVAAQTWLVAVGAAVVVVGLVVGRVMRMAGLGQPVRGQHTDGSDVPSAP